MFRSLCSFFTRSTDWKKNELQNVQTLPRLQPWNQLDYNRKKFRKVKLMDIFSSEKMFHEKVPAFARKTASIKTRSMLVLIIFYLFTSQKSFPSIRWDLKLISPATKRRVKVSNVLMIFILCGSGQFISIFFKNYECISPAFWFSE